MVNLQTCFQQLLTQVCMQPCLFLTCTKHMFLMLTLKSCQLHLSSSLNKILNTTNIVNLALLANKLECTTAYKSDVKLRLKF